MSRLSLNMVKTADYVPTFPNDKAARLALQSLDAPTLQDAVKVIRKVARTLPTSSHWRVELNRLAARLSKGTARYRIFSMKGNAKLPFASFSTLPVLSCPGVGECAAWCYSFRAWRMPESFGRQLQNSLLLRHAPDLIANAFNALPENIVLRLYVDGDFSSLETVRFWFKLLKARPDIRAYGYSKSWDELHAYGREAPYPTNYVLNLSSGGAVRKVTQEQMARLPITRGRFVAVPIHYRPEGVKGNIGFKRYADRAYHDAVRTSAAQLGLGKVFSCPGNCGTCAGGNHACGSSKFDGVTIAIGIH